MNISSTERRRNDKTRWWFAATAVVDYLGQAIHVVDGPTVVASFLLLLATGTAQLMKREEK